MKSKLMARGTLAGVFVILLSLVLIISALPVQAFPQPGHHFYGDVIGAEPGDVISARIGGTEYATTTVDAQGRYGYDPRLVVPSDDRNTRQVKEGGMNGDMVKFYILDKLAGKARFEVWGLTKLNLSIREAELTVTSGGNGSTDPSGTDSYPFNTVVDITATAEPGYELDYWLVNNVDSGNANPISITMDGDYTVQANFAEIKYQLTVTSGGNGTTTPSGTASYACDEEVSLSAEADTDYEFVGWTGSGVVAGAVDGPNSADTFITMNGDYTVQANFAEITSTPKGGNPGGTTSFEGGSLIALVFIPDSDESLEDVLAKIACGLDTCSGGLQTVYLYDPDDANGPWVEKTISCNE